DHMPGEDGCTLKGSDRATIYTVTNYVCTNIYDGTETGGGGEYYGSGGGTDSGTGGEQLGPGTTQPCNGSGVSTNPLDPNTNISEGGCSGIPTVVTVPNPADDPCVKTSRSISAANTVLKNPTVQSQMDAVLRGKATQPIEYAVAIGTNNGTYDVTAPNPGTASQSVTPVWNLANSSSFLANGHSHAGTPGNPSAGDLYSFLERMETNPNYSYSFVYGVTGSTKEVYALVVNDRAVAHNFLINYPRAKNYDPDTHGFLDDSKLGKEIYKMKVIYKNTSTAINTSGESYDARAVGLAYMLEKLNAGMSIAKVDANGNLKKINASTEKVGNDERAKISKCP
ncbi:hypothetical protein, partial [Chryseobacterium aquaticum]|uniref:hypothetical protein n=1 Tax=Chryseobacterium aquaticum TaxID=452084 RepID=UPI002FCAE0D7